MSPSNRGATVPPFEQMMASEEDMDRVQRRFFNMWVKSWNRGKPLPVDGNISYLFCFVYQVLALPPKKARTHLVRLAQAYPNETKFLEYCSAWLSDCYVLLGDYEKALEVYPPIPISSRGATCTDDILSLKLQTGDHLAGRDVLTLNGPKVTKWGREHLDKIALYLDIRVSAIEKHEGVNLLEEWKRSSHQHPYSVYRGTYQSASAGISAYSFSRNEVVIKFAREKTRDAENSVREEMNIPRVGEGWLGETELYYSIRNSLTEVEIVQHASPDWLGRQHLDVFIPAFAVALEYQGAQHDEPVEYFGGEEAYRATKKRDAAKRRKCTKNGVRLIEVRPGYSLPGLIDSIRNQDADT
jgi:hypothetical protein